MKVAHPAVIFQLVLSVQYSCIRTPFEKLVNGFLVLA